MTSPSLIKVERIDPEIIEKALSKSKCENFKIIGVDMASGPDTSVVKFKSRSKYRLNKKIQKYISHGHTQNPPMNSYSNAMGTMYSVVMTKANS